MTHPSYLGSRDQEDCSTKPAQTNSSQGPTEKILNIKKRALKFFPHMYNIDPIQIQAIL
jgi:hypothetical protein